LIISHLNPTNIYGTNSYTLSFASWQQLLWAKLIQINSSSRTCIQPVSQNRAACKMMTCNIMNVKFLPIREAQDAFESVSLLCIKNAPALPKVSIQSAMTLALSLSLESKSYKKNELFSIFCLIEFYFPLKTIFTEKHRSDMNLEIQNKFFLSNCHFEEFVNYGTCISPSLKPGCYND
jgi:hypothetical protein